MVSDQARLGKVGRHPWQGRKLPGPRLHGLRLAGLGLLGLALATAGCQLTLVTEAPPPSPPPADAQAEPPADSQNPPPDAGPGVDAGKPTDVSAWQPPQGNFPPLQTDIAIGNASGQTLILRVRALKPSVQLDCAKVAKAPTAWLSRPLFAPARTWQVAPGRAFAPVQPGDGAKGAACTALLVDGGGVPMRLLFWQHGDYPKQPVPSTVPSANPSPRLVQLQASGGEYSWVKHAVSFVAPPQLSPGAAPGCGQPSAVEALAWSQPLPQGDQMVIGLQSAPNGCHFVELLGKLGTAAWMVCLPPGAWPFEVGDEVYAAPLQGGHNLGPVQGLDLLGDGKRLRFGRGADVVYLGNVQAQLQPLAGCAPGFDPCGSVISGLQVALQLPGAAATALAAGAQQPLGKTSHVYLVRSFDAPVVDGACTADLTGGRLVESVFVEGAQ